MIRRFGAFLTALVLLLCCSVVFACNVRSEALPASEEEDYGLIQSENIIITVFTEGSKRNFAKEYGCNMHKGKMLCAPLPDWSKSGR